MRQRAAASDIVIVNHHLLCADAAVRQNAYGEVIPACASAVIDEAHQLEDVATQYFGYSVSTYRLEDLARDAERLAVERSPAKGTRSNRAIDGVRDERARVLQRSRWLRRTAAADDGVPRRGERGTGHTACRAAARARNGSARQSRRLRERAPRRAAASDRRAGSSSNPRWRRPTAEAASRRIGR